MSWCECNDSCEGYTLDVHQLEQFRHSEERAEKWGLQRGEKFTSCSTNLHYIAGSELLPKKCRKHVDSSGLSQSSFGYHYGRPTSGTQEGEKHGTRKYRKHVDSSGPSKLSSGYHYGRPTSGTQEGEKHGTRKYRKHVDSSGPSKLSSGYHYGRPTSGTQEGEKHGTRKYRKHVDSSGPSKLSSGYHYGRPTSGTQEGEKHGTRKYRKHVDSSGPSKLSSGYHYGRPTSGTQEGEKHGTRKYRKHVDSSGPSKLSSGYHYGRPTTGTQEGEKPVAVKGDCLVFRADSPDPYFWYDGGDCLEDVFVHWGDWYYGTTCRSVGLPEEGFEGCSQWNNQPVSNVYLSNCDQRQPASAANATRQSTWATEEQVHSTKRSQFTKPPTIHSWPYYGEYFEEYEESCESCVIVENMPRSRGRIALPTKDVLTWIAREGASYVYTLEFKNSSKCSVLSVSI